MFLINVGTNRVLREADVVRVTAASPRRGVVGKVVGYDLSTPDTPLVVQYPRPVAGVLRETFGANDVEVVEGNNTMEAPETLEPLPEIQKVLQEERPAYKTCGRFLCMTLRESGTTLTFVPRENGTNLRQIVDQRGVEALFEVAFVTRLPHLVQIGQSQVVSAALETENALEKILASEV